MGSFYSTGANPDFLPSPLLSYSSSSTSTIPNISSSATATTNNGKNGYPISFIHLGRQGTGTITLFAPTLASRRKWIDTIERYRYSIMAASQVFRMTEISHHYFNGLNRVHCAATYGPYIIFGSDHGVYLKKPISNNSHDDDDNDDDGYDDDDNEGIVQLVAVEKVSQIDILESRRIMLVLADKILYTYVMDTLLLPVIDQPQQQQRKSINSSRSSLDVGLNKKQHQQQQRKISNNVSFFKVGQVYDKSSNHERTLVCYVKYNAMTSTIRALELCHEEKRKSSRFLRNDVLKGFKDLYIPGEATSIQYFKHVICVGSAKGFQMVDIGSAGVQSKFTFNQSDYNGLTLPHYVGVLDPNDEHHNFVGQRENLRPISMFRHPDGCILLCYNGKVI